MSKTMLYIGGVTMMLVGIVISIASQKDLSAETWGSAYYAGGAVLFWLGLSQK